MNDTITVYEKCEHGYVDPHWTYTRTTIEFDCFWQVTSDWKPTQRCPGGRKIILQRRRKYWHQADPDRISGGDTSTWFVPVDKDETVWVEVSDE